MKNIYFKFNITVDMKNGYFSFTDDVTDDKIYDTGIV